MKKITYTLAILFFILPSVSSAAALTQQQSTSLIAVVQSSPGTPASAFISLITAFSNITTNQATSLITVVQSAPGVPANAFVDLLTSFTVDTPTTQTPTPTVTPNTTSVAPTATTQSTNSSTQTSSPSLIAGKNTAYANQTMIAGSNNVKLGSFTLSQNTGANVSSIYLDFIGNASVTNLTLKDNATGNLISSATRTTPTTSTDNGFSVNLQIQSWETRKIDVYGNIPSGAIGTIQATLNTKTSGTITNSGNSIWLASAVPLQIITVIDVTPKISFSFNGSDSTTNTYTTTVGNSVQLGWHTTNSGGNCTASGDWSGEKIEGNSENITFTQAGTFNYTLACMSKYGEKTTNTATITATAPEISIQSQVCNLSTTNFKTEYSLGNLLANGNIDGRIFMNAHVVNAQGQNYYSSNPSSVMTITTSDHSNDKTLNGSGNTGPCGYYYPYEFYSTSAGTYSITFSIPSFNLSKTVTITIAP